MVWFAFCLFNWNEFIRPLICLANCTDGSLSRSWRAWSLELEAWAAQTAPFCWPYLWRFVFLARLMVNGKWLTGDGAMGWWVTGRTSKSGQLLTSWSLCNNLKRIKYTKINYSNSCSNFNFNSDSPSKSSICNSRNCCTFCMSGKLLHLRPRECQQGTW